jgi:hypothetical protein
MRKSLKLSFGIHSIELFNFAEGSGEPTFEQIGDTVYGIAGQPIDSGIQYEAHRIYAIDCFLTHSEKQSLMWLFQASERVRVLWNQALNYSITLEDRITPYLEPGAIQTRAVATGETVSIAAGGLSYPAQFKVRMSEPEFKRVRANGTIHRAKFNLKETDRVIP